MNQFFIPLKNIPTITHQQKKVNFTNKRFYEPAELKSARAMYMAKLGQFVPEQQYVGAIRLTVKWIHKSDKHDPGEWKITKPDLDNSVKLLLDCMTDLHYWKDDAQVASLIIEKFYDEISGLFIKIEELI